MTSDKADKLRLNHFLARCGVASRRGAEDLVAEGRVEVNGKVASDLSTVIDPDRDSVKVDGHRVRPQEKGHYFALYKPKEVVSTLEDPEGRPCLRAFFPREVRGLFPVGRLDYHSEGLLLLTNDGDLSNRLLHPRYKVVKVYQVKVKGNPAAEALERLRKGIVLDGRRTLPVAIRRVPSRETRHTWVEVQMTEGRKNQIREMFFRIEHPVIKLKRVSMGPVALGKMKPGEVRPLTPEEVTALRTHAGLEGSAPATGISATAPAGAPRRKELGGSGRAAPRGRSKGAGAGGPARGPKKGPRKASPGRDDRRGAGAGGPARGPKKGPAKASPVRDDKRGAGAAGPARGKRKGLSKAAPLRDRKRPAGGTAPAGARKKSGPKASPGGSRGGRPGERPRGPARKSSRPRTGRPKERQP